MGHGSLENVMEVAELSEYKIEMFRDQMQPF